MIMFLHLYTKFSFIFFSLTKQTKIHELLFCSLQIISLPYVVKYLLSVNNSPFFNEVLYRIFALLPFHKYKCE